MRDRRELLVRADRRDQHLERRDKRRQREHATVLGILTSPVRVLKQRIKDTANAERRLDNIRHKAADALFDRRELNRAVLRQDLKGVPVRRHARAAARELALHGTQALLVARKDSLLDGPRVLLELRAEHLFVDRGDVLLVHLGLLESLLDNHAALGLLGMHSQIERAAVRAADTLNPAVARLDLSVPAVAGVVCHLIAHVLAEAHAIRVDTNSLEEKEDAAEEVAKRLVVHHTRRNSVAE